MSDQLTLDDVKAFATKLSPWAHLASVGAESVKARNVAHHADIAMHWQVTEVGDGVELWGSAEMFTDLDTKRRLWTAVFDYDLNAFAPGGPENSPETGFLAITPDRAVVLHQYGMGGIDRWSAQ